MLFVGRLFAYLLSWSLKIAIVASVHKKTYDKVVAGPRILACVFLQHYSFHNCFRTHEVFMTRNHRLGILAALSCLMISPLYAQRGQAEPASDYGIPQVKKINEEISQLWKEFQITPSNRASDGEWCRRLYLDVLGRIPSVEELTEFLQDKDPNKRRALVNKLLHDDNYTEEYARNWTTIWTNVLIGRNGGTERDTLTSREGMQKYLRDTFARNKPYNRMVYELVTATGNNKPGKEGFNGAVNYLAMKVNEEKGTLATSSVSKTLLGLQVQCTQCHNHPFNEWKQQKFWEFNAFFRQTRMLRRYIPGTRDIDFAELVDEDYEGELNTPENAAIFYELRNGLTKVAYPAFVDGKKVESQSGFVEDVVRRQELAKFMMDSEFLDKMIVNRMWAHFMGYGFTKPIDDLGPHNPPTHPALLDYLGQEVRNNSYDLKTLISWIVLSEPYALSSKMNKSNTQDDPLLGETPKFSHFYLRQMQAEQLYESLIIATQAHKSRGGYEEQEKTKTEWLKQFTIAFGTDEGGEATTFNCTIPQALMLFNGDLVKQATSDAKGSFLWSISTDSKLKPAGKIEHLFLAGMARKPSRKELSVANQLLRARWQDAKGDKEKAQVQALQDIWWAVLNSNEFIINH